MSPTLAAVESFRVTFIPKTANYLQLAFYFLWENHLRSYAQNAQNSVWVRRYIAVSNVCQLSMWHWHSIVGYFKKNSVKIGVTNHLKCAWHFSTFTPPRQMISVISFEHRAVDSHIVFTAYRFSARIIFRSHLIAEKSVISKYLRKKTSFNWIVDHSVEFS